MTCPLRKTLQTLHLPVKNNKNETFVINIFREAELLQSISLQYISDQKTAKEIHPALLKHLQLSGRIVEICCSKLNM